ncbi:UNVERIFIED_CONTAM: hypothetical protein GTU68_026953 [Idotea baltica]|nr:hypothetical protein [Idotea baltica]
MLQTGERSMDCEGGYESPGSPPAYPLSPSSLPGRCSPLSGLSHQQSPSNKDKALFTFKQVNLICEQLVREREVKIREEYDKVLSTKLAEQYDCFVRFTADQIQQRLSQAALPSCKFFFFFYRFMVNIMLNLAFMNEFFFFFKMFH